MSKKTSRRSFIEFLGMAGSVAVGSTALGLSGCVPKIPVNPVQDYPGPFRVPFTSVQSNTNDVVTLAEGLRYDVIARFKDQISSSDYFGTHADYTAFLPTNDSNTEGLLWVNHEYVDQRFVSGYIGNGEKTKQQVDLERYSLGGSIIKVRQTGGKWEMVKYDPMNRRVHGGTEMDIAWHSAIRGRTTATGTMANCSGGVTPWGTILTCEENYQGYYGEREYHEDGTETLHPSYYGWEKHYDNPPEHYGWVVEVDPKTGEGRKLIALGRCAHECATPFEAEDGRLVVYTGDDANDQCLYKFISSKPRSLTEGTLYVANIERGEWISLSIEENDILKKHFKNQTEVLIRLREAAKLVGGTPLARPEDIDIDPLGNRDVFVSLTNNYPKGDYYGEILKIREHKADKTSLTFDSETFLAGGIETGFACPDNLAFDPAGNLWITSDISGSALGNEIYKPYLSNGLYLVPRVGEDAGKVICVATAPVDAEFTGPYFSADGKTLFLSVQHPGEKSPSLSELTSHWPDGGDSMPKSSVIAITGPSLEAITRPA